MAQTTTVSNSLANAVAQNLNINPVPVDPVEARIAALTAALAEMQAQNAALAERAAELEALKTGVLTCHISEKGCLSIYGLGRNPLSLYKEQVIRLLDFVPTIKAFLAKYGDGKTVEVWVNKGVKVERTMKVR